MLITDRSHKPSRWRLCSVLSHPPFLFFLQPSDGSFSENEDGCQNDSVVGQFCRSSIQERPLNLLLEICGEKHLDKPSIIQNFTNSSSLRRFFNQKEDNFKVCISFLLRHQYTNFFLNSVEHSSVLIGLSTMVYEPLHHRKTRGKYFHLLLLFTNKVS